MIFHERDRIAYRDEDRAEPPDGGLDEPTATARGKIGQGFRKTLDTRH